MVQRPTTQPDPEQPSEDPRAIYREILKKAHADANKKGEPLLVTPLQLGSSGGEVLALQAVLVLLDILEAAPAFEIGTFDKPTLRALSSFQYEDGNPELKQEIGTLGEHTLAILNYMAGQLMVPKKEAMPTPREDRANLEYLEKLIGVGTTALRRMVEAASDPPSNEFIRTHLFLVALVILGEMSVEDLLPCLHPMTYRSESQLKKWYFYFTAHSRSVLETFQHRYAPQVRTEDFGVRVCDETWTAMEQQLTLGLGWRQQSQRPAAEKPRLGVAHSITDDLRRGWNELQLERIRLRSELSRRRALHILGGAAFGIAGAAGVGWYFREPIRKALWGESESGADGEPFNSDELRQTDDLMQRRVDRLELPDDLTDTEVLLWAAAPVYDGQTQLSYDTVLSSFALSRHLFKGKFLLKHVGDGSEDDRGARQERMYSFMIPGTESGELLDYDEGQNTLNEVSWAHALNLLTRAPHATDDEVKAFLVGWYEKTFVNQDGIPIRLDPSRLIVHRFENGWIKSVFYSGSNAGDSLKFNKFVQKPGTPQTGSIPGRTYQKVPKQLTKNGRLLVWTGVNQLLVIPQSFLAEEGTATLEINGSASVSFTWKELADSIRAYFSARNDHVRGWSRFVQYNNPIIQRLAQNVMGEKTDLEGLESLRIFGQKIPYEWESAGVEVNRPAIATLLQAYQESGGDCNNRAVALASLFKAGGYRTAIIEVAPTSEQRERLRRKGDENAFYSHLLVAVHLDHFKDSPDYSWYAANAYSDSEHSTDRWMLVETGENWEFGSQLPDGYFIEEIEEIR